MTIVCGIKYGHLAFGIIVKMSMFSSAERLIIWASPREMPEGHREMETVAIVGEEQNKEKTTAPYGRISDVAYKSAADVNALD
jgi:hypothetical protein